LVHGDVVIRQVLRRKIQMIMLYKRIKSKQC